MKIKLSKSNWELVGRKAGWLKTAIDEDGLREIEIDEGRRAGEDLAAAVKSAPHTLKKYRCKRCGHISEQKTNHYGPTWSSGHFNTCPQCPPWAKYPEYKGHTEWECLEADPANAEKLRKELEDKPNCTCPACGEKSATFLPGLTDTPEKFNERRRKRNGL